MHDKVKDMQWFTYVQSTLYPGRRHPPKRNLTVENKEAKVQPTFHLRLPRPPFPLPPQNLMLYMAVNKLYMGYMQITLAYAFLQNVVPQLFLISLKLNVVSNLLSRYWLPLAVSSLKG